MSALACRHPNVFFFFSWFLSHPQAAFPLLSLRFHPRSPHPQECAAARHGDSRRWARALQHVLRGRAQPGGGPVCRASHSAAGPLQPEAAGAPGGGRRERKKSCCARAPCGWAALSEAPCACTPQKEWVAKQRLESRMCDVLPTLVLQSRCCHFGIKAHGSACIQQCRSRPKQCLGCGAA